MQISSRRAKSPLKRTAKATNTMSSSSKRQRKINETSDTNTLNQLKQACHVATKEMDISQASQLFTVAAALPRMSRLEIQALALFMAELPSVVAEAANAKTL